MSAAWVLRHITIEQNPGGTADVHQTALLKALKRAVSSENTVIFTIMDGNMANLMFPPFLSSLQKSGEARNLLVVCQDDNAYELCISRHQVTFVKQ